MPKPLCHDATGQLAILTIDDDGVNHMVMEQLLKPQGWKILTALDSVEAMEVLDEEAEWPDIVLLDYTLRDESGEEVCCRLTSFFNGARIPIVMCTAMSEGSTVLDECFAAGAADVLYKPYDLKRILAMLQKHCGAKAQPMAGGPVASTGNGEGNGGASALRVGGGGGAAAAAPAVGAVDVVQFCSGIGLEYCGKKLATAGMTTQQLKGADDGTLRRAGIVVKAQRDKLLEAAALL